MTAGVLTLPVPLYLLTAMTLAVLLPVPAWSVAALASAVTGLAALRSWRAAAVSCLCAVCAWHAVHARDAALAAPLATALDAILDDRQAPPVWLRGRLLDDANGDAESVRISFEVEAYRVDGGAPWIATRGRAQLAIGGREAFAQASQWTRGRRITLPALIKRPQIWRNPGSSSPNWQQLRRGVDVIGSVKSAALVDVVPGAPWAEWGARVRAHVRAAVRAYTPADQATTASVVIAILIGDRSGLDDEVVRRLQMAGTYHVIAISGGNIALLSVASLALLRLVSRRARLNAALTLVVVVAYCGVVGDQASVARAEAAAVVVLGLQVVGWCAPPSRIFLAAALAVAVADPLTIIDIGAWLSFGATAGILVMATPITRAVETRVGVWPAAVALFAATLAAELALAPVSASVFGRVGVAGLVLNFIAIPAMALTQFCGMALVCLAPLWPAAAHGCGLASAWATTALVRSADLLLWAPWLSWQTPPVAAAWSAIYYLSLATLAWAATRRVRRMAWLSWSLSALVIVTGGVAWPASSAASLRVTMLDVGQGQAIAVQFPTGQTLLVDAGGGGGSFDVGARVVEPALWALGIRRVDWLAITHGDADHAGGAPSVLRDFHPREIWEGIPVPRDRRMQMLRADAQSSGVVWRRVLAGHAMEVGSVAVDVLGPPAPDWDRRDNRNDDSVVIRLRYGDVAVLLTGDVERAAEAVLPLDRVGTLRFVSAPHHGSRTSSTPAFIHRWLPLVAFVSAGRGNSFGHPSSDVLARYSDRGVDVVRTDLDGAITLDTDGRTVTMSTISGRRWRFETVRLTGVGP